MPVERLSKPLVTALPHPVKGQALYWDSELQGFGVRVTAGGKKTYIAQSRVAGRTVRVKLGLHGHLWTDQARRQAQIILGKLASGTDVNAERRLRRIKALALRDVFKAFRVARPGNKPKTLDSYARQLDLYVPDWLDLPWTSISRDMVAARHRKVGVEHGERTANNLMRVIRSVLNFAMGQYRQPNTDEPLITQNPVRILSDTRSWFKESARDDHLRPSEIAAWWNAVARHGTEIQRDYLYTLLLTGCRALEIATLRVHQVDLKNRVITLHNTKNGQTHRIPVSKYLAEILARRVDETDSAFDYVFPASNKGPSTCGHTKYANRLLYRVARESGVNMRSRHGLRRTFASIGEQVAVGTYTLKRLMNHITGTSADITLQYAQLSVEQLREPAERISTFILKCAGVVPSATVTTLHAVGSD